MEILGIRLSNNQFHDTIIMYNNFMHNGNSTLQYKYKQTVYATLQVDGIHSWPECPLIEVDFLQTPHRHVFHIKAVASVDHDDRFIEFIVLKHDILEYLRDKYWDNEKRAHVFGRMSCEQLAIELIERFNLDSCDVSEDNENGSIVTRVPAAPHGAMEKE